MGGSIRAVSDTQRRCAGVIDAAGLAQGTMKGVGRIYQQTFIDTYSKVGMRTEHNEALILGTTFSHRTSTCMINCQTRAGSMQWKT